MTLSLPDSYRPPARAASVPFTLNGNIPQVDGRVDGRHGALKLDTGDRSSLTLYVPFVEQNGLRGVYKRKVEAVTGYGIGGPVPAEVVRVGSVRLGGYEVSRVVARMPQLRQGAYMDSSVMGSVGTKFLRRFKVTFDYARRRIYLEPSEKFNEPDVFDKLGAWYSRHGTDLELTTLTQGGAAQRAGLKVGDVLLAINGRELATTSLPRLREYLNGLPDGMRIRLRLRGGRKVIVRLKDSI
jgi:hypothetical protein